MNYIDVASNQSSYKNGRYYSESLDWKEHFNGHYLFHMLKTTESDWVRENERKNINFQLLQILHQKLFTSFNFNFYVSSHFQYIQNDPIFDVKKNIFKPLTRGKKIRSKVKYCYHPLIYHIQRTEAIVFSFHINMLRFHGYCTAAATVVKQYLFFLLLLRLIYKKRVA